MKLLIYLRFLRPLRSLLFIAIYTGIAENSGHYLFSLDQSTAWFLALAVALPLLLGLFIAWAAHEPMHRSFALILPNLRNRQRTAAAVSILVATLATTCAATWANPSVSPFATFGLGCVLVALPCIDRHQHLGGLAGAVFSFLGWLSLVEIGGAKLPSIMNTAPWFFLLGGLAVAAVSLVLAFSRESLRARADILFIAYQTNTFSYLFHRGMVARWQAELAAQKSRKKGVHSSASPDWEVRPVGASSLDWIRIFWHANFGAYKQSFIRVQLRFATPLLINVAVLSGTACIFDQKEYWWTLAQMAAPGMKMGGMIGPVATMLQPGMAALCMLAVFTPKLAYPISRTRLASAVFWQTGAQWVVALVLPATTIFLASLIGQIMSGKFLPGYGLPALLTVDLTLVVLLPLLAAAGTLRRPSLRIMAAVPVVGAIMVVAVTSFHWRQHILTLPSVCFLLLAAAGSQWLLWHRLHCQYATSDFPLEAGFGSYGAIGAIIPR